MYERLTQNMEKRARARRTDRADEEALEVGGHVLLQLLYIRDGAYDIPGVEGVDEGAVHHLFVQNLVQVARRAGKRQPQDQPACCGMMCVAGGERREERCEL